MAVTIKVEGVEELRAQLQRLDQKGGREGKKAVVKTLIQGESHIKRMLSGSGSGVVYSLYSPKRTHQASAPGHPPAKDLGNYAASWRHRPSGWDGDVYTEQERGPALEYGYAPNNLKPRPHAGPTSEYMREQFVKNATAALKTLEGGA